MPKVKKKVGLRPLFLWGGLRGARAFHLLKAGKNQ
jgi:hypothetical protein